MVKPVVGLGPQPPAVRPGLQVPVCRCYIALQTADWGFCGRPLPGRGDSCWEGGCAPPSLRKQPKWEEGVTSAAPWQLCRAGDRVGRLSVPSPSYTPARPASFLLTPQLACLGTFRGLGLHRSSHRGHFLLGLWSLFLSPSVIEEAGARSDNLPGPQSPAHCGLCGGHPPARLRLPALSGTDVGNGDPCGGAEMRSACPGGLGLRKQVPHRPAVPGLPSADSCRCGWG